LARDLAVFLLKNILKIRDELKTQKSSEKKDICIKHGKIVSRPAA